MDAHDVAREVTKIADVLSVANEHFAAEAKMNAALHMATEVRPAPLAAAVSTALQEARLLAHRLTNEPFAAIHQQDTDRAAR